MNKIELKNYLNSGFENKSEQGGGIFDSIKNFFSPRLDGYNNISKKTIHLYGDYEIKHLSIYRTPLTTFNNNLINIISLGSFNKIKKKLGNEYDKLYHLALIASINYEGNIKNICIEKNATIEIKTDYETNDKTEILYIPLNNKKITINYLLDTTRKKQGDKYYFAYSALSGNNCQNYILELLKNVNIYNDIIYKFIFQDISKLIENMPQYMTSATDFLTNFHALYQKWTGKGLY